MLVRLPFRFENVAAVCLLLIATAVNAAPAPETNRVLTIEGVAEEVQIRRLGATTWDRAYTNAVLYAGDWFRTGPRSRALLGLSNRETFRVAERSVLRVPEDAPQPRAVEFLQGLFYFFHRDKPRELELRTRLVNSVVRGTEFVLEVEDDGTTMLHLIDGAVTMTNAAGTLDLSSGESARVAPGRAPARTVAVEAMNVIQWCLYYPAVLDLDELPLAAGERQALAESIQGWRSGDLLAALARYPAGREPATDAEKIYLAALLLSVGQVTATERLLAALAPAGPAKGRLDELADALRTLMAAVRLQPGRAALSAPADAATGPRPNASALLARSYEAQARADLPQALSLARQAAACSTNFAFAHARVAELEFSFGRVRASREALGLVLAPRHAQVQALRGFLLAAEGRFAQAGDAFDQALALDGGLGNAWLGRGLCRIQRGEVEAGLHDLQAAATVEPQRAILRSYLAKAWHLAGDMARATNELRLARELDPRDPTAWLYSALFHQEENRVNEAVRDLEHSQALNDNRRVYRSRLLLEQDRAVRSANLANIYRDAGMTDLSLREAARAVSADDGNYSAHLFLANSYEQLRDPRQINLRYETATLNEFLLANLLAPAAAGVLSPALSQQDYTRLLEGDHIGFTSSTEYFSSGDWVQTGAQYGLLGDLSYSLEANYRSESGQRPNNDLEMLTLAARVKLQLTPRDSVLLQAFGYGAESGDVTPIYSPADANTGLRTEERQEPLLFAGWHRDWAPGSHTLALVGRLADDLRVRNTNQATYLVERDFAGDVAFVTPQFFNQRYRSEFEIYTAELQQILETPSYKVIGGGRLQWGEFDTRNEQTNARPFIPLAPDQTERAGFGRGSAYAYSSWHVLPPLTLHGGVSYDHLRYPDNHRYAPVNSVERTTEQVSPKAGVVWRPANSTTVRAAYAQALGGVSFDQSFQLEPTQVAGFNQAFRSIIPEAIAGANAAARFELAGVSLEQVLPTGTYLGWTAEWLHSDVERTFGVAEFDFGYQAAGTPERFDHDERTLSFTLNQLLGDEWSLGLRYRLSDVDLNHRYPKLVPAVGFDSKQDVEATLHRLDLFVVYNHPSGVFARTEAVWSAQSNRGYATAMPGDDFWQFHAYVGYRFVRRRAEVRLGLLNLTDQDYRLNPLNFTAEPPRERTFTASLRLGF